MNIEFRRLVRSSWNEPGAHVPDLISRIVLHHRLGAVSRLPASYSPRHPMADDSGRPFRNILCQMRWNDSKRRLILLCCNVNIHCGSG